MKHEGNPRRAWGQIALCLSLLAGGLFCLAITMAINFDQGWSLGASDHSRLAYSASALAVDVVGVGLFALVAGLLYRNGQAGKGFIMSLVVVAFACFSMVMFYGFGATNRIAPAKAAEATRAAEASAKATADIAALKRQEDHISFLRNQVRELGAIATARTGTQARRDAARAQQQAAIEQLGQAAFGTVTVDVTPIAVDPDPQAKAIADDLGLSTETVQKVLTGLLGFLLITAKALSFHFAARLWPAPPAKVRAAPVETEQPSSQAPTIANEPLRHAGNVVPITKAQGWLVPDRQGALDLGVENEAAVVSLANDLRPDIEQALAVEQIIERFVAEGTFAAPESRVQSIHSYRHFSKWLEWHGYESISPQLYGRTLAKLNRDGVIDWPRGPDTTAVYYHGRDLDFTQEWSRVRNAANG